MKNEQTKKRVTLPASTNLEQKMAEKNDTTFVAILPDGTIDTFGSIKAIIETFGEERLGFRAEVVYTLKLDYYQPVDVCGVKLIKTKRKTKKQRAKE